MKKFLCLITALALVLNFSLTSFASQEYYYIIDEAGILSGEEWSDLEKRATDISNEYNCAVYAIILNDYSKYSDTVENCGLMLYEELGLGYGEDKDALLLLLSMADRDYFIYDFGSFGQYVLTDDGRISIEDEILDDLADDQWYSGLYDYLYQCEFLLQSALYNEVYGEDNYVNVDEMPAQSSLAEDIFISYGLGLAVSLVIAFITCSSFKSQMKTVVRDNFARNYIVSDNINISARNDVYSHTSRSQRRIETSSSRPRNSGMSSRSSGSRGGGSRGGSSRGGGKF